MGKSKKDAVKPYYRTRSEGPVKLKKTSTANTEMQIAVIIGVPRDCRTVSTTRSFCLEAPPAEMA
jgi:hypothetical protein